MAAFFDDSGAFIPEDSGNYACFGMLVIPTPLIRTCGNTWQEMLELHFQCPSPLRTIGIEVKSSELCDMLHKLKRGKKLQDSQQKMLSYGLDNVQKVDDLINDIILFWRNHPQQLSILLRLRTNERYGTNSRVAPFQLGGFLLNNFNGLNPKDKTIKRLRRESKH